MLRLLLITTSSVMVIVTSGCGAGIGPGQAEGEVDLTVTRDYGKTVVAGPSTRELRESDTVMSLVDEIADVETRYGGRFVQAIDGVRSSGGARTSDWFYFVNGVEAEVGAATFRPGPGDSIWWDFRDWTEAMYAGAVTGSYPAPLSSGPDGRGDGAVFTCFAGESTCRLVRSRLEDDGIELQSTSTATRSGQVEVVVGPIAQLERSQDAYGLEEGPRSSGVFARLAESRSSSGAGTVETLNERGEVTGSFGAGTGLVAAVRSQGQAPVWLVTGTDERGVARASAALEPEALERTYAVVVPPGQEEMVPVPTESGGPSR